jgi:hypothetical protein
VVGIESVGFPYWIHVRCHLRFISHSDDPNAAYYNTLEVGALMDIAPGEEITHDYLSG